MAEGVNVKPVVIAIVVVLVALVVGAVGVGGWLWFKRPLTVFEWNTRNGLRGAGLRQITIASPAGPQVMFKGGSGPTVVLLHGAGDQAGTWFRVVPDLVKTYSVVVPDLAGHGKSAPRTGPINMDAVMQGLEAVLAAEASANKLILVGNSLGAWVAMLEARRHPERVGRIVAIDGGALKGSNEHARVLPRTREEARESVAQTRDATSAPIPDFVLDDIVRRAQSGSLARFAATAASMEAWVLDETALAEIKVPIHIVWGTSDRLMPLDYAQRMKGALPNAQLTTIEKCGHVPQVECPDKLLAALRPILAGKLS